MTTLEKFPLQEYTVPISYKLCTNRYSDLYAKKTYNHFSGKIIEKKLNTLKTVYKLSLPEPASFFSYEGPFLCQRMNTYVINTEFFNGYLKWKSFSELKCLFNFNLLLGWAMGYICLIECLWLWYVFIIFIYLFIFCYVILYTFPFKHNFRILVVNWRQIASFKWNSFSLSMKEYMIYWILSSCVYNHVICVLNLMFICRPGKECWNYY